MHGRSPAAAVIRDAADAIAVYVGLRGDALVEYDGHRRVVRPGGTLFFTIPFIWDEHEQPYDFGRYTSFGIEAVLRRNGFTNVRVRKTTSYFRAASQLMIAYVYQHVFPRNPRVKRVLGMLLIAPVVAVTILADKILPRSHDCYCNLAVTCEHDGKEVG